MARRPRGRRGSPDGRARRSRGAHPPGAHGAVHGRLRRSSAFLRPPCSITLVPSGSGEVPSISLPGREPRRGHFVRERDTRDRSARARRPYEHRRAAGELLRRQRGLPLPRPGVRGAPLRPGRAARRCVAANRLGCGRVRALAPAVAEAPRRRLLHEGSVAMGAVLAVMNACFYIAIDRLPLGTVAAIEFLPVIALAAAACANPSQRRCPLAAVAGVYLLTDVRLAGEPLGIAFAFANACSSPPTSSSRTGLPTTSARRARRARRRDARRGRRRRRDRHVRRGPGARRPDRPACGHRRRHLLVGDPLRLRPAGDGADAAFHLCAPRLGPARDRDALRHRRPRPDPTSGRGPRSGARDARGRAPPRARRRYGWKRRRSTILSTSLRSARNAMPTRSRSSALTAATAARLASSWPVAKSSFV